VNATFDTFRGGHGSFVGVTLSGSFDLTKRLSMNQMSRRQFLRVTGATIAGSSLALSALRRPRPWPKSGSTSWRHHGDPQHLPLLLRRLRHSDVRPGRRRQERQAASIIHIEGDPDHPVNRGTLCPKGASLIDFIHSPESPDGTRNTARPAPRMEQDVLGRRAHRIARLMKEDRDANFIEKKRGRQNRQPMGQHRHAVRLGDQQRGRLHNPQDHAQSGACWHSTTRRVSDTVRRWQVLPRRLAVER
jgi:formate dehydrogenase major subunit